jgi:hypothetical protein
MLQDSSPTLMMLILAVGAGLLAVFVVWVSKQIANEETRSQGMWAAGIALGFVALGFVIIPATTDVQMAPPTVVSGVSAQSGISVEHSGVQVQIHGEHPTPVPPTAPAASRGVFVGYRGLAWGPLAIAVLAVGVITIAVSSKRGMAAALASLGIVAGVLVMFLYSARQASSVGLAPPRAILDTSWDRTIGESVPDPMERIHTATPESGVAVPEEIAADEKNVAESGKEQAAEAKPAEAKPAGDGKAEAESPAAEKKTPPKDPPPAWINSEPNLEAGVYSSVVVSGPYSTKRECLQRLDNAINGAVKVFVEDNLRPRIGYAVWARWKPIEDRLVESRYFEQVQTSVGPMWNLHVLLTIDHADKAYFQQIARSLEVQQAVEKTSIGGFTVLGALAVLYIALKYPCRKKCAGIEPAINRTSDATT